MALALVVVLLSVQCTKDDSGAPSYPTSIDSHFASGSYEYDGITIPYRDGVTLATTQDAAPLVVVLHGQYGSGSDNRAQLRSDAMIRIWQHLVESNTQAVVLVPQCSARRAWDETKTDVNKATTMSEALKALIDHYVANNTKVDPSKIYILGYSDSPQPAGAGGVWRMLSDYTDLFAAGMVVAADPDEEIVAANIAKTPLLVVNGASDVHAVGVELATFIDEVKEAGGEIREVVMNIRSREELCRDAFTAEHLSWVLQF
jgi:predicted peptidase